jgi:hypothetical protein
MHFIWLLPLIGATHLYRPSSDSLLLADLLVILAGIAFGLVHPFSGSSHQLAEVTRAVYVRYPLLAFGVLALLLVAERNGGVIGVDLDFLSLHVQFGLLVVGTALIVAGTGGVRRVSLPPVAWPLVALTLLALLVRTWDVRDTLRASMDEGPFVMAIVEMRADPFSPLLMPVHIIPSFTRVFPYIQMVLSDLLGSSWAVLRLTSAIFGALTVPALYFLARELFDRPTAWVAAAFLATFPPHIHMSRIAINNIADPLCGVLALGFLVRALKTQDRLWYMLAGAMLGWLAYFYEGGELLYPALVLAWLVWLTMAGPLRPDRRGVAWMVGVMLLVAMPTYAVTIGQDAPMFTRLTEHGMDDDYWTDILTGEDGLYYLQQFFRQKIMPPLLHYIHKPDASIFYGGETALVLPWLVPLFFLGVYRAMWRPRGGGMLLLLWIVLTALGNSLIQSSAWTARFVVAMPGIVLLMAWGVCAVVRERRWLLVIVNLVMVSQVAYYFGPHQRVYQQQIPFLLADYDVLFRMQDLPEDTVIFFGYEDWLQVVFTREFMAYLGVEREFYPVSYDDFVIRARQADPDRDYAFFFSPEAVDFVTAAEYYWTLDGPYESPYVSGEQFYLYFSER